LSEARERTLDLIADLSDEQMIGPRLAIVNPLRWEIAHVAWFQEYWLLRRLRRQMPAVSHGDSLYDSTLVAHDTGWEWQLPPRAETIGYMQLVLDRVLGQSPSGEVGEVNGYDETYFLQLALFHEDMRAEAITYTACALSNER
jgi:iron(II)-dependent oxidoreductase